MNSGRKCLKKVENGKITCPYHSGQTNVCTINKECPICLESCDLSPWFEMSCNHGCHYECMFGLCKTECPVCRKEIKNLSEELINTIKINKEQREDEIEIENYNESMRTIFNLFSSATNGSFQNEDGSFSFDISPVISYLRNNMEGFAQGNY